MAVGTIPRQTTQQRGQTSLRRVEITFQNTQLDCPINLEPLREIVAHIIQQEFATFEGEACFHLVTKDRMAEVNYEFLKHEGPTDVITFDLAEDPNRIVFLAEIYICPAVAEDQAAEFGTSWQDEILRYHVHALLHLQGYDDLTPEDLKVMKHHEDRIMQATREQFQLTQITTG